MTNKVVCECGWKGTSDELLFAASPFRVDDGISACPQCKVVDALQEAVK